MIAVQEVAMLKQQVVKFPVQQHSFVGVQLEGGRAVGFIIHARWRTAYDGLRTFHQARLKAD